MAPNKRWPAVSRSSVCERVSPLQAFMLMAMARKDVLGGGGESRLIRNGYRGNFDKATALCLKRGAGLRQYHP